VNKATIGTTASFSKLDSGFPQQVALRSRTGCCTDHTFFLGAAKRRAFASAKVAISSIAVFNFSKVSLPLI